MPSPRKSESRKSESHHEDPPNSPTDSMRNPTMQLQDALQLALIICLVFVGIMFVWLAFPTIRWPRLQTSRPTGDGSLRQMIRRSNRQPDEPLPKYSLRGQPGAGVSLQLGLPVVIEERASGAIVVRSVQPVVASGASIPIALLEDEEVARRSRTSRSSAAELYMDPVPPGIAPSGALPVVHVTLSLPPPPGYGDKSGVSIEVGDGVAGDGIGVGTDENVENADSGPSRLC